MPGGVSLPANGAVRHSRIVTRPSRAKDSTFISFMMRAALVADELPLWGTAPITRDKMMREFWRKEPLLKTGIFAVCQKYAAMEWSMAGPPRTRDMAVDMLNMIEDGDGWMHWVAKLYQDVLTCDNRGYSEILRTEDDEEAPCVGLKQLDSARCRATGSYAEPVVYWDDDNNPHVLKHYQIAPFADFPSGENKLFGQQLCAVSRIIEDARYMRDIAIFSAEKVAGTPRAIHIVGGVSEKAFKKAMETHKLMTQNRNTRYMEPPVMHGNDPATPVSSVTLEMASLPDGFSEDVAKKWFYVAWTNALGVDLQELAPLPAGNLGTSQQSQILDSKGQAKGPAFFQKNMAYVMNYKNILPRSVTFSYSGRDLNYELAQLEKARKRADERAVRIASGEIDAVVARQLAVRDGDLPPAMLASFGEENLMRESMVVGW